MSILVKYAQLLEQNEALTKENVELKAWKETALSLNAEMNEQSLAKMLGGELGKSCRKIIAEKVPMLVEENKALNKELQFLRSQYSRWQLETSIINDILDGKYEPVGTDFDYETDLTHKIQKMMENKTNG